MSDATSGRLLTAAELAEHLRVKAQTVRDWATSKRIPAIRLSRQAIRFRLADVLLALSEEGTPNAETGR